MIRFLAALLTATALSSGAMAWNVDPNLVSSSAYPPSGGTVIAENSPLGITAVAYWSQTGDTRTLVYSQKDTTTGAWNPEPFVAFTNDATTEYQTSEITLDLTPAGRPIIGCAYYCLTKTAGEVTGAEAVCRVSERTPSGPAHTRSTTYTYAYPNEQACLDNLPSTHLSVGDNSNIILALMHTNQVGDVQTINLTVEVTDGPDTDFARKELLYTYSESITADDMDGAICGGALTYDPVGKCRMILNLLNAEGSGRLNYWGYKAIQSAVPSGLSLQTIHDILCGVTTTSVFGPIGVIADAIPGPMFGACGPGACLGIVFLEPGSGLVRYAYELEPASTLWLETSVIREDGQPASLAGTDYQYIPFGISYGETPRLVIGQGETLTGSGGLRIATKDADGSSWTWSPLLPMSCEMNHIGVAKTGNAVAFTNANNQVQVARP